jgi:hypothetical protein
LVNYSVAIAVLAAGLGSSSYATEPAGLSIAKETTFITSPLTPLGLPDYEAALNAIRFDKIPLEKNAAVEIARAGLAGRGGRTRQKLLLDVDAAPTAWKALPDVPGLGTMPYWFTLRNPWSPEDRPEIAKWLDANRPILDRIVSALEGKSLSLPVDLPGNESDPSDRPPPGPLMPLSWELKMALMARASRLDDRSFSQRMEDIDVLRRLGLELCREPLMARYNTGVEMIAAAEAIRQTFIVRGGATRNELAALRTRLARSESLPTVARALDGQQLLNLHAIITDPPGYIARLLAAVQRNPRPDEGDELASKWAREIRLALPEPRIGQKLTIVLKACNAAHDAWRESLLGETGQREAHFGSINARRKQLEATWAKQLGADPVRRLTARFAPDTPRARQAQALKALGVYIFCIWAEGERTAVHYAREAKTKAALTELCVGLTLYKADKGDWPERIEDLLPRYLREVPRNQNTGQPVVYLRQRGGFSILPDEMQCPLFEYHREDAEETTP